MRTTIDIPDAQRARLLELAARRGEKGFSRLVSEAIERMLTEAELGGDRMQAALALQGTLDAKAADELESEVARIRSTWR